MVSFWIRPDDGLLPEIMQRVKQTYAVRYNVHDGRTRHIWGDRYQSEIVAGPPKDAEEYVFAAVEWKAGRRAEGDGGGTLESGSSVADPAMDAKGRPRAGETARNTGSPPDLPRSTDP
ncbi:MAG: hypothetical protein LBK61_13240 [Spirochaetaceae bacterium]|nr:hypothetical protein [Spirochaetaceae bacterium]